MFASPSGRNQSRINSSMFSPVGFQRRKYPRGHPVVQNATTLASQQFDGISCRTLVDTLDMTYYCGMSRHNSVTLSEISCVPRNLTVCLLQLIWVMRVIYSCDCVDALSEGTYPVCLHTNFVHMCLSQAIREVSPTSEHRNTTGNAAPTFPGESLSKRKHGLVERIVKL